MAELLLANEKFTQAFPSLIKALNGDVLSAVVLQCINYRSFISKPDSNGETWVDLRIVEIAEEIGISKAQAQRAINKLRSYGLLMEKQHDGYNNMKLWRIDHDGLQELQLGTESNLVRNRTNLGTDSNQPRYEIAVSTYIEEDIRITKEVTRTFGDEIIQLSNLLAELIESNGVKKPSVTNKWHQEMEKLHRIDEYSYEQIEKTIRWAQNDSFWRSNILSPAKLRKQFGALQLRMNGGNDSRRLTNINQGLDLIQQLEAEENQAPNYRALELTSEEE
jgi:hypothetical protein